jgi:hypothetical protein
LDSVEIRTIEFLSTPQPGAPPVRLQGTVRTRQGDFTGFLHWNRKDELGMDELEGVAATGEVRLRFDTIRSITRRSRESSSVTLVDGRGVVLSGSQEAGEGNRGIYVDDPRYGRVLVSWEAFERADFSNGIAASGPAYAEIRPGRKLTGSVTTRSGSRLAGRLVFDLDESETTDILDAPSRGVDYAIPFSMIASIVAPGPGVQHARVTLQNGLELALEPSGDLGESNAGILIFLDGGQQPEYVPWTNVQRMDFDVPQPDKAR